MNTNENPSSFFTPPLIKRLIWGAVGLILLLIVIKVQPITYENIDAGNTGIKINLYGADRGVDNIIIVTGRAWYNKWYERVVEFPTYTQTKDYDHFSVYSLESSQFRIDPKITFAINEKLVPHIYKTYRRTLAEIQATFIRNEVFNSYRTIAARYTADSLMRKRTQFEKQVEIDLNERLNKDGFINVELTAAIDPPDALLSLINSRNATIQARMKADQEVLQAEAEGKVKKATADADATALLVRARAESEANKLKQQTLSPMLIQQQFISKWDGVLPVYSQTPQLFKDISK